MKQPKNPLKLDQGKDPALWPVLTHDRSLPGKIAPGSDARQVFDDKIMVVGIQLVSQLHILFKTVRIHEPSNAALFQILEALLRTIQTLAQDRPVALRVQSDFLYLGTIHLKPSGHHTAILLEFIDLLNARGVGKVSFGSRLQVTELQEFAYLFMNFDPETATLFELRQQLKQRGVYGIDLEEAPSVTIRVDLSTKHPKTLAKNLYLKAIGVVGEVLQNIKEKRSPNFRQAKRVIQHLVDLIHQDEQMLLGLTTLRCYDQYTHNHSVNVSLLAIAMANRVGYPKPALVDLGVAALFHDLGKTSLSNELLNKLTEFTEEEWALMQRHPVQGVISLARFRGLKNVPVRMAAAAFEHHMTVNFSGYPKLAERWDPSLSGRILMIADCYDGMTSSRVYRRTPIAPHKALQMMYAKSCQTFDSTLLKLFVNCIGLVPIGSLALLDTNELAVVLRSSGNPQTASRPWVKLITDAEGNPVDGPEVDLCEMGPSGHYTRSMVRLVDNTEHRFDTSRYFV